MRFVVNDRRQVMGQYTYSPFGACAAAGGEPHQENGLAPLYRYAGEPWSAEAGLTYLRARQYDPATGRFLTRDSFPGFQAMPQSLHPYAYVGNNPVNLTDPSGRFLPVGVAIAYLVTGVGFLGGEVALFGSKCGEGNCWRQSNVEDVLVWGAGGALIADTFGLTGAPYLSRWMAPERMTASELGEIQAAMGSKTLRHLTPQCVNNATSESEALTPLRMPNSGSIPTGLKVASPGLRALFSQGTVRGNSIINIRSILLNASETPFTQGLAWNKNGYLFTNGYGQEAVRIMNRNGGWDIRIQNFAGNYLDEFGNVNLAEFAHGIEVYSR